MDLAALAEIELAEPDGVTHRIGDLLEDRTTLLVFLRHFG